MGLSAGIFQGVDGTARTIEVGLNADAIFLMEYAIHLSHHTSRRARCRLANFVGTTDGAILGVARTGESGVGDASFGYQGTTEGISSITATGFTVTGTFNTAGRDYVWIAFQAADNEVAIGSYAGTGGASTISLPFDAELFFLFNRATATVDQHSIWTARQMNEGAAGRHFNYIGGSAPAAVNFGAIGARSMSFPGATNNRSGENYEYLIIGRGPFTQTRMAALGYDGDNADGRILGGAVFNGALFTPGFAWLFKNATGAMSLAIGAALAGSVFNQNASQIETLEMSENNVSNPDSSPNNVNTEQAINSFREGGVVVDAGGSINANETTVGNDRHVIMYLLRGGAPSTRALRLGTRRTRVFVRARTTVGD